MLEDELKESRVVGDKDKLSREDKGGDGSFWDVTLTHKEKHTVHWYELRAAMAEDRLSEMQRQQAESMGVGTDKDMAMQAVADKEAAEAELDRRATEANK